MTRGPYDQGDYRLDWQIREDLLPEFDEAGDPFDPVMWERAWDSRPPKLSVVTGGAGGHEPPAPVGARHPDRSHVRMSFPSDESRPDAQVSDVSEPGGSSAGLA